MEESTGEWSCTLILSNESRFCLYASDECTSVRRGPGERHLPDCICPNHTGLISDFLIWRAISYKSRSHLVFLQGKLNSALNIAQVVNPVLLPFLRQQGAVLFQQDNARPFTAAAMQRALRGPQKLP